jgi:hypothetical protein
VGGILGGKTEKYMLKPEKLHETWWDSTTAKLFDIQGFVEPKRD